MSVSDTGDQSPALARRELWARVAIRTAVVAGVFVVLAAGLLAWDYGRRLAKDPLESEQFKTLKTELAAQPQNEDIKTQIRGLDRLLRAQYFQQRRFAAHGGWILLAGVLVFVTALRTAATLRRKLPQPEVHPALVDTESGIARKARWAVAGLGVVLAVAGIGFAWGVGSVVTDYKKTPAVAATEPSAAVAAKSTPAGASVPGTAAKTSPQAVAASGSSPTQEEWNKNWPQFRGPSGMGVATSVKLPTSWDGPTGKNILWKTAVPLEGNSSPVVWNDRVFLTGATDQKRQVYCFNAADGKLVWQQDMPATPSAAIKPPEVMGDTGYAASTPATDGHRVYVMYAIGDVAAFDFTGKLAWVRSLGIPKNAYGHATSLAIFRNLLLVQFDQGTAKDGKSKLFALDSTTGKTVWEVPRPLPNSWATPIVISWKGQEQIITCGDPWVIAYQPADGKELWRVKCLGQDVAAMPAFADGVAYIANANAKATAIRVDGHGDVTETHSLWTAEDGLPDISSPLATPQLTILLTSSGTLTCYDAKSGKKLWEKDFESTFKASPTLCGKSVYLVGDEGKAWIVEPSPSECKIIAQANVGEACFASPAFQDARIFIRGKQHLFCIGNK